MLAITTASDRNHQGPPKEAKATAGRVNFGVAAVAVPEMLQVQWAERGDVAPDKVTDTLLSATPLATDAIVR